MGLSCLIIEDNARQSEAVKLVVQEHFQEITNVHQTFDLSSSEAFLNKENPDLVLADLHLPDGHTFDLFRKMMPLPFKVIFISSHGDYAIEAFKFSALSYLLKPFDDEELISEIRKTISIINKDQYQQQLESLMINMNVQQKPKRLVLKNHDLIHVVSIDDIHYAQADNNYTHFFCEGDRKILVSKSLKTFDEQLSPQGFFRCHNSYLINLNKVKALHKSADAVILQNEANIPVASSKKKLLFSLIG